MQITIDIDDRALPGLEQILAEYNANRTNAGQFSVTLAEYAGIHLSNMGSSRVVSAERMTAIQAKIVAGEKLSQEEVVFLQRMARQ